MAEVCLETKRRSRLCMMAAVLKKEILDLGYELSMVEDGRSRLKPIWDEEHLK